MGITPLHSNLIKPGMSNERVCGRLIIYLPAQSVLWILDPVGVLRGPALPGRCLQDIGVILFALLPTFTSIFFPDLGPLLLSLL